MFCKNCGAPVQDGEKFCNHCGSEVTDSAIQYQQPVRNTIPAQPELPMKWFKFLIYFSLFAGAVLNVITGISTITGVQYRELKETVYSMFEGLQTVDILYGICLIALAAFSIYVRTRLAGFCENGPKLLIALYGVSMVLSIAYTVAAASIISGNPYSDTSSMYFSLVGSCIGDIVLIVANNVYFKKRAHLFVKNEFL